MIAAGPWTVAATPTARATFHRFDSGACSVRYPPSYPQYRDEYERYEDRR